MAVFSVEQLQAVQFFSALTTDDCERLLDRHLESSHGAEQVFVMEQDWGESVFLLCSGMAKVRSYTADGDEVVMSVLGAVSYTHLTLPTNREV